MLLELLLFTQSKLYIEGLILPMKTALQEATPSVHGSDKNSYLFYIKKSTYFSNKDMNIESSYCVFSAGNISVLQQVYRL